MSFDVAPSTVFLSILGLVQGYFFLVLAILLADPLTDLAHGDGNKTRGQITRRFTHAMAILFLIAVFFSLSLPWFLLFAGEEMRPLKHHIRAWFLFWFVGMALYLVVLRIGRSRQ
jgi:archaellum biogenesis protein FlaJ (TadC family)